MQKKRPKTAVFHLHDDDGTQLVKVSLKESPNFVTLNENDFHELLSLGIRPDWTYNFHSRYVVVVRPNSWKNAIPVARIIMDAGRGESVKYLNNNTLDLRRKNLIIAPGSAQRRARDFLDSDIFDQKKEIA